MNTQDKTAGELRLEFETTRLALPTEHLQKLGTEMLERSGLPDFQIVLHPELEPLRDVFDQLLHAEQREAPSQRRA